MLNIPDIDYVIYSEQPLLLPNLQLLFKNTFFGNKANQLNSYIDENSLSAMARLQIYHNNFFISLTKNLQSIYPILQKIIGEECFNVTATQYIYLYPPISGDIHQFGNHFANFLANLSAAQSLPYLSEIALLEWAYHEAFHEADCTLFDLTKLQQIPEEKYGLIQFKLHPSARIFAFKFPIMRIWSMCQNECHQNEININAGGENILVIRRDLEITFAQLSDGAFTFLNACKNGFVFEQACAIAMQVDPELNINSFLQKHLLCGTIVDIA